jgi:hypothetical protein
MEDPLMPWIVPVVILALAGPGSFLFPAIFVPFFTTAFGTALIFGSLGSLGLTALKALVPKPNLPAGFAQQALDRAVTVRQSVESWQIVYGKTRTRGTLTFLERGAGNQYIYMVVTFTGHQIQSFDEILFDDQVVPLDGSGNATGNYAGFVHIETDLGDPANSSQPFPGLAADLPSKWGSNDLQRGRAKLYARIKLDTNKFPNGIPNIRATIKGKLLFDPRSSTTAWSDNSALCARDWFLASYGYGGVSSEIDDTLVNAAANVCDELVSLAAGGSEKRYTCNGAFRLGAQSPEDVMIGILSSMAGDAAYIGDKYLMYAGAWRAPSATISERDFLGEISYTALSSSGDTFNSVKGVYVGPSTNYQPTDYPFVTNSTYQTQDGGVVYSELDLPFTDTASRAQRIAKIRLEDSRRMGRASCPLKLRQFNVTWGDNINLNFSSFSFVNKTFRVLISRFSSGGSARKPVFGVDLDLKESDANVYAWSTSEEKAANTGSSNSTGDVGTVAAPTGLALSDVRASRADGSLSTYIQATWTAPADQLVTDGGSITVQYRVNGTTPWLTADQLEGDTVACLIDGVTEGVAYDVRVFARNVAGASSTPAEVDNHTVNSSTAYFIGGVIGRSFGKNLLGNPSFESNISNTPINTDLALNANCSDEWYVAEKSSFWTVKVEENFAAYRSGARNLQFNTTIFTLPSDGVYYGARVYTKAKIPIAVGDIVRVSGWIYWLGISIPAGFDIVARVGFFVFSANDTPLGELFSDWRAPNTPYTFRQVSLQVPATLGGGVPAYIRVQAAVFISNSSGSPSNINTGWATIRFDDMKAVLQNTAFDLTPLNTSGTFTSTTNPLSQSGATNTIDIASRTLQTGDGQVGYNSGSYDPGSTGTWYVTTDDPTYSGGAVSYTASATPSDTVASNGRVLMGRITTVGGGGATGAGGGTGGGGPRGKEELA